MSAIRIIYEQEPSFPATDQHPSAVRYLLGARYVDAIGGEPTQAEIDAVLSPPKPPREQSAAERVLIEKGLATKADFDADNEKAKK